MSENDKDDFEDDEDEPEPEEEDEKWIHLSEEEKQGILDYAKEVEEENIRERKKTLLDKLEKQMEESGKQDEDLKQIAELKQSLQVWKTILENPSWEQILKTFFSVIYGLKNGMCSRMVLTVECKDGQITLSYEYFDKDGKPVITEFNKVAGEGD